MCNGKVDSEPSHTSKMVLFAKLDNGFKLNYFCKNLHTRRLIWFLMLPLVILPTLILRHIIHKISCLRSYLIIRELWLYRDENTFVKLCSSNAISKYKNNTLFRSLWYQRKNITSQRCIYYPDKHPTKEELSEKTVNDELSPQKQKTFTQMPAVSWIRLWVDWWKACSLFHTIHSTCILFPQYLLSLFENCLWKFC